MSLMVRTKQDSVLSVRERDQLQSLYCEHKSHKTGKKFLHKIDRPGGAIYMKLSVKIIERL